MNNDAYISRLQSRVSSINSRITSLNNEKTRLLALIANLQETFGQRVLSIHNTLMDYFQENYYRTSPTDNDFIIPYVPTNFNIRLQDTGVGSVHGGVNDYDDCLYPYPLGSDSGGILTYIDMQGYFGVGASAASYALVSSSTTVANIVNTGTYYLGRVELPPAEIGGQVKTINVPFYNFTILRSHMNTLAYNRITWTIARLTIWARNTAFLAPLNLCQNYYWTPFGDGLMSPFNIVNGFDKYNLSVSQTPSVSTKDSSITLPNSLQRDYYDRLYDFVKLKKFRNKQEAVDEIKNFVI